MTKPQKKSALSRSMSNALAKSSRAQMRGNTTEVSGPSAEAPPSAGEKIAEEKAHHCVDCGWTHIDPDRQRCHCCTFIREDRLGRVTPREAFEAFGETIAVIARLSMVSLANRGTIVYLDERYHGAGWLGYMHVWDCHEIQRLDGEEIVTLWQSPHGSAPEDYGPEGVARLIALAETLQERDL